MARVRDQALGPARDDVDQALGRRVRGLVRPGDELLDVQRREGLAPREGEGRSGTQLANAS